MLTGVQETITTVANTIGDAIVGVGRRRHVGSGVVTAPNTVLTNAHNVYGSQSTVTFADGSSALSDVKGIDTDGDLAVIAVDTGDVAPVGWGSEVPTLGAPVVGLSNPGGRGLRVTVGYVSGVDRSFRGPRGRRISGSIEHTAPLLPGSSGGPIVDDAGRVLGINTNRLGEGFYLAIAADEAMQERVERLAAGDFPQRRHLGVSVVPGFVARKMRRAVGLPDADGILVRGVATDGPAAFAGLVEGDLLAQVGNHDIREVDDLHDALDAVTPGEPFAVRVLRGTEELELTVTIPD